MSNNNLKLATPKHSISNLQSTKQNIINLDAKEVLQFFLKSESYCNFPLPRYFTFGYLIEKVNQILAINSIDKFKVKKDDPSYYSTVNHIIFNNKDGQYAWRPLQLIHPAIYTSLVRNIADESHWAVIQNKFADFTKNNNIDCISMPIQSLTL